MHFWYLLCFFLLYFNHVKRVAQEEELFLFDCQELSLSPQFWWLPEPELCNKTGRKFSTCDVRYDMNSCPDHSTAVKLQLWALLCWFCLSQSWFDTGWSILYLFLFWRQLFQVVLHKYLFYLSSVDDLLGSVARWMWEAAIPVCPRSSGSHLLE